MLQVPDPRPTSTPIHGRGGYCKRRKQRRWPNVTSAAVSHPASKHVRSFQEEVLSKTCQTPSGPQVRIVDFGQVHGGLGAELDRLQELVHAEGRRAAHRDARPRGKWQVVATRAATYGRRRCAPLPSPPPTPLPPALRHGHDGWVTHTSPSSGAHSGSTGGSQGSSCRDSREGK